MAAHTFPADLCNPQRLKAYRKADTPGVLSKYELCMLGEEEFNRLTKSEPYATWATQGDLHSLSCCELTILQFLEHGGCLEAAQQLLQEAQGSVSAPQLYIKAASCLLYYLGDELAHNHTPGPNTGVPLGQTVCILARAPLHVQRWHMAS